MLDIEIVEDPAAAAALMDPLRARILSELTEPRSAATLAQRVGLPRQKVNYHLRALEERGLARVAEERKWGGITERRLVATAATYAVSPDALGPLASDPERTADRLSAGYLIALAARAVREVGRLVRLARAEEKQLATLSIDTQIKFATPADRSAFTQELGEAITNLALVTTNLRRRAAACTACSSSPIPSKRNHEHRRDRQRPAPRGDGGRDPGLPRGRLESHRNRTRN